MVVGVECTAIKAKGRMQMMFTSSTVAEALRPRLQPSPALHLARHLGEHGGSQHGRISPRKLVEGHELNQVSPTCALPPVHQSLTVRVQCLHRGEVRVADADDNDGERCIVCGDNRVDGLVHVRDGAVGEYHQYRVDVGRLTRPLRHVVDGGGKVRGTAEGQLRQQSGVGVDDGLHAGQEGVLCAAVERKEVAGALSERCDGSEAVRGELPVAIVLLHHVTDRQHRSDVRIGVGGVVVVEGVGLSPVTVTAGKVNREGDVQLQTGTQVVNEAGGGDEVTAVKTDESEGLGFPLLFQPQLELTATFHQVIHRHYKASHSIVGRVLVPVEAVDGNTSGCRIAAAEVYEVQLRGWVPLRIEVFHDRLSPVDQLFLSIGE
ncbi:copine I-like protein [Angomonas deanei]|uniref:Uncharacterized protein n=1 Tax=Angomonas deanei TaxID=59799 RepID=A0A7G2CGK1_9TRYP|nr:copine I-like protein [Angomonas deanei]CAD2218876.1 hypothetical protein, conserved [Angomonas deanei]|eukprot:EPY25886.1 copine I-like protein [Angomonas deanei]